MKNHSSYLNGLDVNDARLYIASGVQTLQPYAFDAIAFSGMSGALYAPRLADALSNEDTSVGLILVRKADDRCHSSQRLEGALNAASYIIVDDFVGTGATVARILDTIALYWQRDRWSWHGDAPIPKCVGIYAAQDRVLYTQSDSGRVGHILSRNDCGPISYRPKRK